MPEPPQPSPQPRWLKPRFVARVWGSRDLRAWFPEREVEEEAIGEAWLTPLDSPVLIKLLFPQEPLSVQVHPDDAYAAAHGLGRGKSEAWYVAEAAPGARLGVGLRDQAAWAELEAACRAGRGSELLHWFEVRAGDVIHVPAGTVHAIGPGVVLCEVQQPSDNTFRLDDYGRGRELHLEHGLAVARPTEAGAVGHGLRPGKSGPLLSTRYFRLARHHVGARQEFEACAEWRWLVRLEPRPAAILELPPGASYTAEGPGTWLQIRPGMTD